MGDMNHTATPSSTASVVEAPERLTAAADSGMPCSPVRDRIVHALDEAAVDAIEVAHGDGVAGQRVTFPVLRIPGWGR